MSVTFGPQLIGQTEKTLNALLDRVLAGRLPEPEWVTLRLAHQADVDGDAGLAAAVADRARLADAPGLVRGLAAAGLLQEGRPTAAGRALVAELQERIAELTAPIWRDLPAADVAAAERVLSLVLDRARTVLQEPGRPVGEPSR